MADHMAKNFDVFPGSGPVAHGLIWIICLTWMVWPGCDLHAETRYVSDEFRITMRKGPAASFKVVRMLKTGMSLELLERDPSGWDKVRAQNGAVGWVLRRFTSGSIPAKFQLREAVEARQKAETERDELREQVRRLKSQVGSEEKLKKDLARVKRISSNALKLEQENEELSQKVRKLERDLKKVSDSKRLLERQSDTLNFLAGAAVLILGLIGGAILARRRRSSYGELN